MQSEIPSALNYGQKLLSSEAKIGIWGAGYIGLSSMAHYASAGAQCIALDVIPSKVEAINKGEVEVAGLKEWLGIDIKALVDKGKMYATTKHEDLLASDVLVHLLAIPTEKDGKPYDGILIDVLEKIAAGINKNSPIPPLVIVESTLTPGTSKKTILPIFKKHGLTMGKDFYFGVAPRRDWFVDNTKSLKDLDRVFGGCDENASVAMFSVLSLVCDVLHSASHFETAEIVKSCENAYRHMEITLANQLSLAYPSVNMREVLKLVGTKWNIGTFYPGFGTGGYCIPLSSQYVLAGAEHPGELSLLSDTIKTDNNINQLIAHSLIQRGIKNVGVLGLSYKANLKVWILSPTIPFVKELMDQGIHVKVADPYYSNEEIKQITGAEAFSFKSDDLKTFDSLVLVVNHDEFDVPLSEWEEKLNSNIFILDNQGQWAKYKDKFKDNGIDYFIIGEANWLGETTKLLSHSSR